MGYDEIGWRNFELMRPDLFHKAGIQQAALGERESRAPYNEGGGQTLHLVSSARTWRNGFTNIPAFRLLC